MEHEVTWWRRESVTGAFWMQGVSFDPSKVRLSVKVQDTMSVALPLDRWGRSVGAMAMINGGYFDPVAFSATGLQVVEGKVSGRYLPFGEWGGGVGVMGGRAVICTEAEIVARGGMSLAWDSFVQASPILVDGARLFAAMGAEMRVRRSFIAHDGGSRWVMAVCAGVGLQELARLLGGHGETWVGFRVQRALNLDGGPSTGLWAWGAAGMERYEKEMWRVKNALMIGPEAKPGP